MARCRVDKSIERLVVDGFAFPLGVYPVEQMTPKQGYTTTFESADGGELGPAGAGGGGTGENAIDASRRGGGGGGGEAGADGHATMTMTRARDAASPTPTAGDRPKTSGKSGPTATCGTSASPRRVWSRSFGP